MLSYEFRTITKTTNRKNLNERRYKILNYEQTEKYETERALSSEYDRTNNTCTKRMGKLHLRNLIPMHCLFSDK